MSEITIGEMAVRVETMERKLDRICKDVRNGPRSKVYLIREWNDDAKCYIPLPVVYSNFDLSRRMLKKMIKERREANPEFDPNSLTIVQYEFIWASDEE